MGFDGIYARELSALGLWPNRWEWVHPRQRVGPRWRGGSILRLRLVAYCERDGDIWQGWPCMLETASPRLSKTSKREFCRRLKRAGLICWDSGRVFVCFFLKIGKMKYENCNLRTGKLRFFEHWQETMYGVRWWVRPLDVWLNAPQLRIWLLQYWVLLLVAKTSGLDTCWFVVFVFWHFLCLVQFWKYPKIFLVMKIGYHNGFCLLADCEGFPWHFVNVFACDTKNWYDVVLKEDLRSDPSNFDQDLVFESHSRCWVSSEWGLTIHAAFLKK